MIAALLFVVLVQGTQVAPAKEPAVAEQEPAAPAETLPTPPPTPDPAPMDAAQARAALDRSLGWLVDTQREDGSWAEGVNSHLSEIGFAWETYYAWQLGAHGLAVQALRAAPETPSRRAALEKAVRWLCETRLPVRGADWDVDATWSSLNGFSALVDVARDVRFREEPWKSLVKTRALEFWADLDTRQTPDGGWAYYDDPPFTKRPKWATSFCTALVIPAMHWAVTELEWPIDPARTARAEEMVRRCRLPNGAYAYDYRPIQRRWTGESINQVQGSLGRIQVGNWALAVRGVPWMTLDELRTGLEQFFRYHAYLDMARLRPIPHEGWYANAGYFYFFAHYYAARVIELLPEEEREGFRARLRAQVAKTLRADGSTSDFLTSGYQVVAATSFASLALELGLPHEARD